MTQELTKEQLYRPGMEGIPACRSKISFIDGVEGILEYRGYRIEDLCEHSTFEEVAYLLLYGRLPNQNELKSFQDDLASKRKLSDDIKNVIRTLPKEGHPMSVLQTMVCALGLFDPYSNVRLEDRNQQAILKILARVPSLITAFDRYRKGLDIVDPDPSLSHAANFLYMLNDEKPTQEQTKVFDVCLILHAEHTINASTFSTLVTAATMTSPYTSLSAGVGTLYGPLHGGANERVLKMLEEIGSVHHVRPFVEKKVANKEKIMGIGHRVYKTKDPRSFVLQDIARDLFAKQNDNNLLDIALELEKVTGEKLNSKGIYPNVDFFSGLVYRILGFETDLFTPIFAASRTAGWLAHWIEQMEDNRLFRPTQIFIGERDKKFIPIRDRD
jgi:citrate synthase